MSNPAVGRDGQKVVAIQAARNDGAAWMEMGWLRDDFGGVDHAMRHFTAWDKGSRYDELILLDDTIIGGTTHTYELRCVSVAQKRWRSNVDGPARKDVLFDVPYKDMTNAVLRTVGERKFWSGHDSTNGDAHFWVLQYYNSAQEWKLWSGNQFDFDDDPNYYLDIVSNTENYVRPT